MDENIQVRDSQIKGPQDAYPVDIASIEAFIRSTMKPVNDNTEDDNYENIVERGRFPVDAVRRVYTQDYYQYLLETNYLYNLVKLEDWDQTFSGNVTIGTNLMQFKQDNGDGYGYISQRVKGILQEIGAPIFSIDECHFHSLIESSRSLAGNGDDREWGYYDSSSLRDSNKKFTTRDNKEIGLFKLANLEAAFDIEESKLAEDIAEQSYILSFQTLATRMTELFAKLSNARMSFLFYTNNKPQYDKASVVAALDIFYNILSKISDSCRYFELGTSYSLRGGRHSRDERDKNASKYSRMSLFNEDIMETMRPSIFIRSLLKTMKGIADGDQENWKLYAKNLIYTDGNEFTWFSRTNETGYGWENNHHAVNDVKLQNDNYLVQSVPARWCKTTGFFDTLTGIHLKLVDRPNIETPDINDTLIEKMFTASGPYYTYDANQLGFDDLPTTVGSNWNNTHIKYYLLRGFKLLTEAFKRCLGDDEIIKVFNVAATNNNNRIINIVDNLNETNSTNIASIGDLESSIKLEKIIEKVYAFLCVKNSTYSLRDKPRLCFDIGLRYLTDSTINENDLNSGAHVYTQAYSNPSAYITRVKGLLDMEHMNTITPFMASYGISLIDKKFVAKILDEVVKVDSDGEKVDSFNYLTDSNWSLCPYRQKFGSHNTTNSESKKTISNIGDCKINGGKYIEYVYKTRPTCELATKYWKKNEPSTSVLDSDDPTDDTKVEAHGCIASELMNRYLKGDLSVVDTLNKVPKTCPVFAVWKSISNSQGASNFNPADYLHTLLKYTSNGELNYSADIMNDTGDYKTESDALGYNYERYNGSGIRQRPPTYGEELHAPIQLTFLDHLIKFIQVLYKVNHYIMYNEPYLKTKVKPTEEHYYGTEAEGTFEPVSCYQFTNFHMYNDIDDHEDVVGNNNNIQLKIFRKVDNGLIQAVNRDLSGIVGDALDRNRKVQGTTVNEYEKCRYRFTPGEIKSGIVEGGQARSLPGDQSFYIIDSLSGYSGQRKDKFETYRVFVKRFRPIYLPTATDLFDSDSSVNKDKDIKNPTKIQGWNICPHKPSASPRHPGRNIIIPMNVSTRNGPLSKWFLENDWDYWQARYSSDKKINATSGYYRLIFRDEVTVGTAPGWNGFISEKMTKPGGGITGASKEQIRKTFYEWHESGVSSSNSSNPNINKFYTFTSEGWKNSPGWEYNECYSFDTVKNVLTKTQQAHDSTEPGYPTGHISRNATNEYIFEYYFTRYWMYPMHASGKIRGESTIRSNLNLSRGGQAFSVKTVQSKQHRDYLPLNIDDFTEKYKVGDFIGNNLTLDQKGGKLALTIDKANLVNTLSDNGNISNFDDPNAQYYVNWFYITIKGPTGPDDIPIPYVVEKCFPFVFWKSSRGGHGASPTQWAYGLGGAVNNYGIRTRDGDGWGWELGFLQNDNSDRNTCGMRWHAIDSILGMDLQSVEYTYTEANENDELTEEEKRIRLNGNLKSDQAYKGAYDPLSAFTNNRWGTRSNYWGCSTSDSTNGYAYSVDGNGGINGSGHGCDNENRYWNPQATVGTENRNTFMRTCKNRVNEKNKEGSLGNLDKENGLLSACNHPMTWSLWNLVRYGIWYNYFVSDLQYDPNDPDSINRCSADQRSVLGFNSTHPELPAADKPNVEWDGLTDGNTINTDLVNNIQEKTLEAMRELYRSWWKRFTYGGQYTSVIERTNSNLKNEPWPWYEEKFDEETGERLEEKYQMPTTWLQAQTLGKNSSDTFNGSKCYIEWTNVMIFANCIYNEISDTHASMITLYTGYDWNAINHGWWHPYYNIEGKPVGSSFETNVNLEFDASIYSGGTGNGWHDNKISTLLNNDISYKFSPTLKSVNRCRNFELLIYRGYNHKPPLCANWKWANDSDAENKGDSDSSAFVSRWKMLKAMGLNYQAKVNSDGQLVNVSDKTDTSYEYRTGNKTDLRKIYGDNMYETKCDPKDWEWCDCINIVRKILPVYPNWVVLHDNEGNPLDPDAVTEKDLSKVIFCIAPCMYWEFLVRGNTGGSRISKHDYEAIGERMVGWNIERFLIGEAAEAVSTYMDVAYLNSLANLSPAVLADSSHSSGGAGDYYYDPNSHPYGEALPGLSAHR